MGNETRKLIAENLMDVRVRITVEVGQTRMPIADILKIRPGEMIGLGADQKEPLKVYVNDKLFALGEVIEANGKYAVRIVTVIGRVDAESEKAAPDTASSGRRSA